MGISLFEAFQERLFSDSFDDEIEAFLDGMRGFVERNWTSQQVSFRPFSGRRPWGLVFLSRRHFGNYLS